eukprot:708065-Ditylum_brightwellii.AAC.1
MQRARAALHQQHKEEATVNQTDQFSHIKDNTCGQPEHKESEATEEEEEENASTSAAPSQQQPPPANQQHPPIQQQQCPTTDNHNSSFGNESNDLQYLFTAINVCFVEAWTKYLEQSTANETDIRLLRFVTEKITSQATDEANAMDATKKLCLELTSLRDKLNTINQKNYLPRRQKTSNSKKGSSRKKKSDTTAPSNDKNSNATSQSHAQCNKKQHQQQKKQQGSRGGKGREKTLADNSTKIRLTKRAPAEGGADLARTCETDKGARPVGQAN